MTEPQIIRLAANATVAKLIGAPKSTINKVSELLSYAVEGASFTQTFGAGKWDGRSSFYARRSDSFPAGFVHMVHATLVNEGHKVQIIKHPAPAPLGVESPVVDEFGNDDPRYDFQLKALRQVEKHHRGILQVATGGGKSKIAKLIVARYRKMTLFLTTRGILMYQMADGFKEAGFNVGYIGDGLFRPTRGVNVGMVQTFVARLEEPDLNGELRNVVKQDAAAREKASKKGLPAIPAITRADIVKIGTERFNEKTKIRNQTIKLLEMFEVVIGEEAHEAGGNSYYEILRHCKNAHIRIALTATPFMRAGAEDNMRLMAAFGPILLKVSEKELINRGILATPYFRFVDSKPHPKLRKTSPWQRAYTLGYMENPYMLDDIVKEAKRAAALHLPVMTLIQRTSHGDALVKLMRASGLRVEFIHGDDDQDARKRALGRLRRSEIDVLIGTTILDVGVDVPAVGLVQLAGGGKAEVALRQRIGRGLRAKKVGPNVCFISDYSTPINSHLTDHTRTRRKIIEDTPGFGENILPPGKDFDWGQFEKSSRKVA